MKYLDLATQVARGSFVPQKDKSFLFGCVAIRDDGAIVVATNIATQNPMPSAHSEVRCLKRGGYGATLYVARIDRQGNWAIAKPCSSCSSLIRNRGVKKVYYTIAPKTYAVWNVQ
jgi:tRNA(Arg) A34 adenosine deaminase TadA